MAIEKKSLSRTVETNLFALPAVILVSLTIYIPFVLSGFYSLMDWNGN